MSRKCDAGNTAALFGLCRTRQYKRLVVDGFWYFFPLNENTDFDIDGLFVNAFLSPVYVTWFVSWYITLKSMSISLMYFFAISSLCRLFCDGTAVMSFLCCYMSTGIKTWKGYPCILEERVTEILPVTISCLRDVLQISAREESSEEMRWKTLVYGVIELGSGKQFGSLSVNDRKIKSCFRIYYCKW